MEIYNSIGQQIKVEKNGFKIDVSELKPGNYIDNPDVVKTESIDLLSENFSIITIKVNSIDWLYLSANGHTRAEYLRSNNFSGKWIAP